MSPVNTWTFLLLLCAGSIVYSKKCIWRQDYLKNFQHMIPESETSVDCQTNITLLETDPLFKTSQVESAARTVRELFYQIIQFYTKHQETLVINQTTWEHLQEDLDHQANLLNGCISSTTENRLPMKGISHFFIELEKILEEQDDAVCARRIIHANIKQSLLQAARLSGRMFLKTKSQ